MQKALTSVVAGAAAFFVGSKWVKARRARGLGDPVSTVKGTVNRAKERVRSSNDPDSEPVIEDSADSEETDDADSSDDAEEPAEQEPPTPLRRRTFGIERPVRLPPWLERKFRFGATQHPKTDPPC